MLIFSSFCSRIRAYATPVLCAHARVRKGSICKVTKIIQNVEFIEDKLFSSHKLCLCLCDERGKRLTGGVRRMWDGIDFATLVFPFCSPWGHFRTLSQGVVSQLLLFLYPSSLQINLRIAVLQKQKDVEFSTSPCFVVRVEDGASILHLKTFLQVFTGHFSQYFYHLWSQCGHRKYCLISAKVIVISNSANYTQ